MQDATSDLLVKNDYINTQKATSATGLIIRHEWSGCCACEGRSPALHHEATILANLHQAAVYSNRSKEHWGKPFRMRSGCNAVQACGLIQSFVGFC